MSLSAVGIVAGTQARSMSFVFYKRAIQHSPLNKMCVSFHSDADMCVLKRYLSRWGPCASTLDITSSVGANEIT